MSLEYQLVENFKKAMDYFIRENSMAMDCEEMNIKHFLGIQWGMSTSLMELRTIIKDLVYGPSQSLPSELRSILKACLWTMNDIIPHWEILCKESGNEPLILSLLPSTLELFDKMRFYLFALPKQFNPRPEVTIKNREQFIQENGNGGNS